MKKCIKCGAEIPDDAAFCPHCETVQNEIKEMPKPRLWRKKAAIAAAVLAIAAIVLVVCLRQNSKPEPEPETDEPSYSEVSGTDAPVDTQDKDETDDNSTEDEHPVSKTYEGGADLVYDDGENVYHLILCLDGGSMFEHIPQSYTSDRADNESPGCMPSLFTVYYEDTGKDAQDEFFEKVESCGVSALPMGGGKPMNCSDPYKDPDIFTDIAYVSDIEYIGDCGKNEIRWTFNMKNGDTLIIRQTFDIELLESVTITYGQVSMLTTEELQEVFDMIDTEIDPNMTVYMKLPPVTYEGELRMPARAVNITGSSDGTHRTTFTQPIVVDHKPMDISSFNAVRFIGSGEGTALTATRTVVLISCEFTGWDIGIDMCGNAWVHFESCKFNDNNIAYRADILSSYFHDAFNPDNVFNGNRLAAEILNIPINTPITFMNCEFIGNDEILINESSTKVELVDCKVE